MRGIFLLVCEIIKVVLYQYNRRTLVAASARQIAQRANQVRQAARRRPL